MITKETVDFVKRFEGYKPYVYLDPVGVPTAGYGTTKGLTVSMVGTPITQEQAEQWLREDLEKFEKRVMKYNPIYHWTSNEKISLISFAYNIGNINGLTKNGMRTRQQIADAMLTYNKAGGKVLNGLTKRRQAERELFLGNSNKTVNKPTLRRGASGKAVGELQRLLGIKDDKIFGYATETAVKIFQKQRGLVVDGCVGQKTWTELLK